MTRSITILLFLAFITSAALNLSACDKVAPKEAQATPAPVAAPAPAPPPAPTPAPAPKPEPEPEPAPEVPAKSGPGDTELPGGTVADGMEERESGLWIGTVVEVEDAEGVATPTVTDDSQAVTVTMSAWNTHGTHSHNIMTNQGPMVMPLDDAKLFPGWSDAFDGMSVGETRKLWAPVDSVVSNQLAKGSPVVIEYVLQGVDEYITLPETLPGAKIGEAQLHTSETGLGWYDLVEGDGAAPTATDRVDVEYTGWLVNGTEFDAGTYTVNMQGGVVAGWLEAIAAGMKVGSKRKIIIPTELAYGWQPRPGSPIPPGATLIFDMEILKIVGADTPASDDGK